MSCRKTYPRRVSPRTSNRKVKKPATDYSNDFTLDHDVDIFNKVNSDLSQSSVEEYLDLFGVPIPPTKCSSEPLPKTKAKSIKKTPVLKKKKQLSNKLVMDNSICTPQKSFTPTPRIIKLMKEAQVELYSLMGIDQSSKDISIVLNDSLNISGIQSLPDSPTSSPIKKSDENPTSNEKSKTSTILQGVHAFVDVKNDMNHKWVIEGISDELHSMGAKVGKTFNLKVTHVVFFNGYPKTYTIAIKRNIPLVSVNWIEECRLAKKILDAKDHPAVGIEKYAMRSLIFKIPRIRKFKCLQPASYERDRILKEKLMNEFQFSAKKLFNEETVEINHS